MRGLCGQVVGAWGVFISARTRYLSICKNDVRARRLCRFAHVRTCLSGLEAGSIYAIAACSSTTPTVSGQSIIASVAVISVVTSLALDLR